MDSLHTFIEYVLDTALDAATDSLDTAINANDFSETARTAAKARATEVAESVLAIVLTEVERDLALFLDDALDEHVYARTDFTPALDG